MDWIHPAVDSARLRVICVGTGRDGTQSVNHMLQHVLDRHGGGQTMHEYCSRELHQAFCNFCETGDTGYAIELRRMVGECQFDCIVGNGYAAILPLFAERYGRDVTLVHLRRTDRAACIASLVKNCELFPTAYGYYSLRQEATVKRMAAFHFGEMSRRDWDSLPLAEKIGWYYDKTHALISHSKALFNHYIEIETEALDSEATRQLFARIVAGPDAVPPPKTHLNAAKIDIASFAKQHQHKMQWLMGRLNLEQVAEDEVYALDYFLEKFVAWMGYQITNAPQLGPAQPAPTDKIAADLDRAMEKVKVRLQDIEILHSLLAVAARNDGVKSDERAAA